MEKKIGKILTTNVIDLTTTYLGINLPSQQIVGK